MPSNLEITISYLSKKRLREIRNSGWDALITLKRPTSPEQENFHLSRMEKFRSIGKVK
jgi:hypothetical protein